MSGIELTELYKELKKGNYVLSSSSPLITNCEAELSELIRQIDIMFKSMKNDWLKERATLELKVDTRSREINLQQESLDRKNAEIGKLREEIIQLEKNDKQLILDYQQQIDQLHQDLLALKQQYDNMRQKHQKEKIKLKSTKQCALEMNALNREKAELLSEVDELKITVKSLNEKCDLMEQQNRTYHAQLEKRKEMISDIEANLRGELNQLRIKLHEVEDQEAERSTEVARLQADVNYWKSKSDKLSQEKHNMEIYSRQTKNMIENLKAQNDASNSEKESLENSLHLAVTEQQQQEKEISLLRGKFQTHTDSTQLSVPEAPSVDLSELSRVKQQLKQLQKYHSELHLKESEYKRQIEKLRNECSSFENATKTAEERCIELRSQLHQKTVSLKSKEEELLNCRNDTLSEIQAQLGSLKSAHLTEVEGLKVELEHCRSELVEAQRANNKFTVNPVSNNPVSRSEMLNDNAGNSNESLVRQLEALRQENQLLREQMLLSGIESRDNTNAELKESHCQQKLTVTQLKAENKNLRTELRRVEEKLRTTESMCQVKYQKYLKDAQTDTERHEIRMRSICDGELDAAKHHYNTELAVKDSLHTQQLSSLHAQKEILENRLKQCQEEIDEKVIDLSMDESRNMNEQPVSDSSSGEMEIWSKVLSNSPTSLIDQSSQSISTSYISHRQISPDVSRITERFMEEQQKRTATLERMLDNHIKAMKY